MTLQDFFIRLGLALLLGITIGLKRQWCQKKAGLRTNTLVSIGSAAFTLISVALTASEHNYSNGADATRITGQIVTDIGFPGGGVILRDGLNVQGLNPAAAIWCSAAVGALAETDLLAEAFAGPLELWMNNTSFFQRGEGTCCYAFKIRCREQVENRLRILDALKKDNHLRLWSLKSTDNGNPAFVYIGAEILSAGNHDAEMKRLAGKLTLEYGVTEVSWSVNGRES